MTTTLEEADAIVAKAEVCNRIVQVGHIERFNPAQVSEHATWSSFDGRYFVLESLDELSVSHLEDMVESGISEILFAITPSIANDAVILYIEDKLSAYSVNFSRIAQGVPTGVSLENIDLLSLTRALEDRVRV